MIFKIKIDIDAHAFIKQLSQKSQTIIDEKINSMREDPYPGKGGNKERLNLGRGKKIYRLHISQKFTAFYRINKDEQTVYITDIMTIEQAHKKYGLL